MEVMAEVTNPPMTLVAAELVAAELVATAARLSSCTIHSRIAELWQPQGEQAAQAAQAVPGTEAETMEVMEAQATPVL